MGYFAEKEFNESLGRDSKTYKQDVLFVFRKFSAMVENQSAEIPKS